MENQLENIIKEKYELTFLPCHMTHINNLSSIVKTGGLLAINSLGPCNIKFMDISNSSVQSRRAKKFVIDSGTVIHDYIPLYFGKKTPMVSSLRFMNESLIFLAFSYDVLIDLNCVITDGNAADSMTKFKVFSHLDDLAILDVKSINSQSYAHNEEIKRRKQSELLIQNFLPLKYLRYVICPNNMIKKIVIKMLISAGINTKVYVGGNSYYYLNI